MKAINLQAAAMAAGVLTAATIGVAAAPDAQAALSYGSIAYADNGAGASTWNYPSRSDAQQAAVLYCGYSSCEVLTTFTDCGVVLYDSSTRILQGAHGPTLSSAIAAARTAVPNGYVDSWACNTV